MNMERAVKRAILSLIGLSIGDAYGSRCSFGVHKAERYPGDDSHILPRGPWRWTDDTAQAIEITKWLVSGRSFEKDELVRSLARRYADDPRRGYGQGVRKLFEQINRNIDPDKARSELFGNQGSFGNGAAMRAAPIGAYYAEDIDLVVREVTESAKSTHSHIEGQAGAIAIAVCAAVVANSSVESVELAPEKLFNHILDCLPVSEVKTRIEMVAELGFDIELSKVVSIIGSGKTAIAVDTVPFCVWSIARHIYSFGEGIWRNLCCWWG